MIRLKLNGLSVSTYSGDYVEARVWQDTILARWNFFPLLSITILQNYSKDRSGHPERNQTVLGQSVYHQSSICLCSYERYKIEHGRGWSNDWWFWSNSGQIPTVWEYSQTRQVVGKFEKWPISMIFHAQKSSDHCKDANFLMANSLFCSRQGTDKAYWEPKYRFTPVVCGLAWRVSWGSFWMVHIRKVPKKVQLNRRPPRRYYLPCAKD